jgi:hypothetical protein
LEAEVYERIDHRSPGGAFWWTIAVANAAAALGSGGFAVAAVVNPGLLLPEGNEVTPAAEFYAKMFAARSLPLSAAVTALILLRSTDRLSAFLIVAGVVQAADALIGASYRNRGQTLAPAAAAALHFASARWLLRGRLRSWYG